MDPFIAQPFQPMLSRKLDSTITNINLKPPLIIAKYCIEKISIITEMKIRTRANKAIKETGNVARLFNPFA